jgi:hypothetical protein
MQRVLSVGLLLILAVAGAVGLGVAGVSWMGVPAVGGVVALTAILKTCRHSGPLALLPPTTDFTGARQPARWYCDRCGKTWEAVFERSQTPVQRFTGYDEAKAVGAAKRAAELADRRRALALDRAGLKPQSKRSAKPAAASIAAAETAAVVQIGQRRRLVG